MLNYNLFLSDNLLYNKWYDDVYLFVNITYIQIALYIYSILLYLNVYYTFIIYIGTFLIYKTL